MNLSELTVLGIASVHELYNAKDTANHRTDRERFGVIYKYEGETLYTAEKKELISSRHSLIFLPKGSDYSWKCAQSGHFIAVEFECAEDAAAEPFTVPVTAPDMLLKKMKEMLRKYRTAASRHELLSLFYGMLASLACERPYTPKSKSERIAPALEFINSKYEQDVTNTMLAELCGISEVYFRKLFLSVCGTSPIRYLHKVRIARAKEMLDSDFGKIGDVGEAVGYSSIYHFSKMFKAYVGVSPREYVK